MSKPVILTGIRANGELTLGNYLGTMLPMAQLQNKYAGQYQVNMFLADMHSIVTEVDYKNLQAQVLQTIKYFIAGGVDYKNTSTYIYRQSQIGAHGELAWILQCFTTYGEAHRMTEFKDKAERVGVDKVTLGLLNYPVLQAADVLLYDAEWIPVGEDQRQHIELMRNLAIRLNNRFKADYPKGLVSVPREMKEQLAFVGRKEAIRIRSLRNPEKKMSKSIEDPAGTILLNDKPDEASKKVMSATTDSVGKITLDWAKQPGISNLLQISALLQGQTLQNTAKEWEGKSSYGELKAKVAEQVRQFLVQFQESLAKVDESTLMGKLEQDEDAMRKVANQTLLKVQKAVGLRPS